jgi:hypothetical protein
MALKPQIVHVVGHSEADHAATAEDVIESCGLARRAIENALRGAPDMTADPRIQRRKENLMAEAQVTLKAIRSLGTGSSAGPADGPEAGPLADPAVNPAVLARAVTSGILDAPHLRNNRFARGAVITRMVSGACLAVDSNGRPVTESERLEQIFSSDKPTISA